MVATISFKYINKIASKVNEVKMLSGDAQYEIFRVK